jgi:hypothetical protein
MLCMIIFLRVPLYHLYTLTPLLAIMTVALASVLGNSTASAVDVKISHSRLHREETSPYTRHKQSCLDTIGHSAISPTNMALYTSDDVTSWPLGH